MVPPKMPPDEIQRLEPLNSPKILNSPKNLVTDLLRESEDRYRTIFQTATIGITNLAPDGLFLHANPAFCALLGYTESELQKMNILDVTHPDDNDATKNSVHCNTEGRQVNVEKRLLRRDGTVVWVRVSAVWIFDSKNRRSHSVAITENITDRKGTEEALREAEDEYRNILDNSLEGFFQTTPDGQILMINPAFAKMFGYDSPQELTNSINDITQVHINPDQRARVLQLLKEQGVVKGFEARAVRKDGSSFWVSANVRSIPDKAGNITYLEGNLEDITNRKEAEEELKREIAFRRAVEESLTSGIYAINKEGKIIYANLSFCKMVGWSSEELLGHSKPHLFWPPEETESIIKTFQNNRDQSGLLESNELIFRRKNGERFPVMLLASRLKDEQGNIVGVLGSVVDISEKKKMEEELSKIEKLKALGILAGGIAHDFNNILTAILGNLSLALLEIDPDLTVSRYLKETEKASIKAKNLASQLLSFTKGEAPKTEIVSIAELITDSTTFALRGTNIYSEFHFPDDLWKVKVDPSQIAQVVHNLVINSQQAMDEGGRIVIYGKNERLDESSAKRFLLNPGPFVLISFKDTGKGIPQDLISKIFDPFFTTKTQGSGLGLFSAYSIVKTHDGSIKVESEVGVGTTFTIYLPAVFENRIEDDKNDDTIVLGSGRILLMDDDKMITKMASAMITTLGYSVEVVNNGEDALEIYREAKEGNQPFKVVILDLTIPGGKGGKQTIKELLAYDPNVVAIVSSGFSTDLILENYQEYGFQGCVTKPYRIQDLSKTLNHVLSLGKSR